VQATISVRDLRKSYGSLAAVDGVTFEVGQGEFFAILGPNGAGKTTTLEILEGLRKADSGEITVLGQHPWPRNPKLLPRIGVQLQASSFFERLTAREQIETFASLYGVGAKRADEMLGVVGLTEQAGTQWEKLSGGQAQRLSIACALVHDPELVFLDEPTAGLDPQARHATWDLIESLRAAGTAVILATHYMEEAERLADRVTIVDHGLVVASGSPAELTGSAGQLRFRAKPGLDTDGLLAALPAGSAAKESPSGHYLVERLDGIDPQLIAAVTAWCAEHGVLAAGLQIECRTLEDVFLELTGRDLRS